MLNEHTGCRCTLKKRLFDMQPGHRGRVIADEYMVNVLWDGMQQPITMYRHEVDIIPAMAVDGVYVD